MTPRQESAVPGFGKQCRAVSTAAVPVSLVCSAARPGQCCPPWAAWPAHFSGGSGVLGVRLLREEEEAEQAQWDPGSGQAEAIQEGRGSGTARLECEQEAREAQEQPPPAPSPPPRGNAQEHPGGPQVSCIHDRGSAIRHPGKAEAAAPAPARRDADPAAERATRPSRLTLCLASPGPLRGHATAAVHPCRPMAVLGSRDLPAPRTAEFSTNATSWPLRSSPGAFPQVPACAGGGQEKGWYLSSAKAGGP